MNHPKPRPGLLIIAIIASILISGTLLALSFFQNLTSRVSPATPTFISPNTSVKQISRKLGEEGVLIAPWQLNFLARALRKDGALKPGEYLFERPTAPWDVLNKLLRQEIVRYKVTFPEGVTVAQIGIILTHTGLTNEKKFGDTVRRTDLRSALDIPAPSFEGFLFPDTYFFSKLDAPEQIVRTMVTRFKSALSEADKGKAKTLGLSELQWITLASIVEKESSWPDEHPLISSVFHNRLKRGMRLQADPTVIYGIEKFDGNLTRKHLETPSPYNTYTKNGLPMGPIANPGASAIHAAVTPADTNFLYFVADRKGRHVFSDTYEGHLRNVAFYQLQHRPTQAANRQN